MKTYLFDIILNRASKQCKFYHSINRNYNKNDLAEFIKKRIENDGSLTLDEIFIKGKILNNKIDLNESDKYYNFVKQINKIIHLLVKNKLSNIFKNDDTLYNFTSNLKKLEQINVNEYFEYSIKKNITPFDFIMYAFVWRLTPQGFTYWRDLDREYRKFLTTKLFNINYNE